MCCWIWIMQIGPMSTNFAKRISYQSTCVKLRTSSAISASSAVEVNSSSAPAPVKETSTISKQFSLKERTSNSVLFSEGLTSDPKKYFTLPQLFNGDHPHRMPIVAAVAAHRRFYPAATALAGAGSGSQRSSCAGAVRLSALNILAPLPSKVKGQHGVVGKNNSLNVKFALPSSGGGGGFGGSLRGNSRPLLELKQLGALLKSDGKGALFGVGGDGSRRHYAKGRDKPKASKTQVVVNENEMAEVIDVDKLKGQLGKVIEEMKEDYTKQLNVRGAAGALESLEVEFDGETYPLQELAQVGRKNPQLAVLNLASLPDAIKPVLQAIEDSGMNLNPQQEGTTIYVPLPKVTREHRENLAKNAKTLFTKYKVALQSVQNKFVKQCRSQKELSDDLLFSVQQQIMKITETYSAEAERLMQLKQKELLEK